MTINKIVDVSIGDGMKTVGDNGGADHIRGGQGDDIIKGQRGDDILEGNRGDDTINGGRGDDLLFGGVGDDTLTGGNGADTFSMRVTNGGNNTITDFKLGEDTLELVFNRKHFVLENDLVESNLSTRFEGDKLANKIEARENKIETKLNEQVSSALENAGEDYDGVKDADSFVQRAVENVSITRSEEEGEDLVLTFFVGDEIGTSITLNGLANDPSISQLLTSMDGNPDTVAIMAKLTKPDTIIGSSNNDQSLKGTDSDDKINALAGNDTIIGSQGNDRIDGGDGSDTVDYSASEGLRVTALNQWSERGKEYEANSDNPIYIVQEGGPKLNYFEVNAEDCAGPDSLLKHGKEGLNIDVLENVEKLVGSDFADTFLLRDSNDVVDGGGGNDWIQLGGGDDQASGGAGNDKIFGGKGDDQFKGYGDQSLGNDTLDGGEGFDTANYWYQKGHINASVDANGNIAVEQVSSSKSHSDEENADFTDTLINVEAIVGTRGEDHYDMSNLDNGVGITITDNSEQASDDFAIGSKYDDNINLGHGNDVIYGGKGNDTLKVTLGNNQIFGEEGNDHINGGNHSDYLNGGDGNDYIVGGNYYGDGTEERDDTLIGGAGEDTLRGGGGNDYFETDGRRSVEDDFVDGGSGYDILSYNDHLVNGLGTDAALNMSVTGQGGNQSIQVAAMDNSGEASVTLSTDTVKNVEEIRGTRGDDIGDFSGLDYGITYKDKSTDAGDEVMIGSDHNDYFNVMLGNDTVHGGKGDDVIKSSGGNNELYGGEGNDTINGGNHEDILDGGEGDDYIVAGNYYASHDSDTTDVHDTLIGGNGNDTLRGSNGNDLLQGGNGEDKIYAGGGNDEIQADQYSAAHKALYLENDTIDGGDGVDSLWYNDTYKNADHLNIQTKNATTFTVEGVKGEQVTSTDTVSNVEILFGTRGDDIIDFSGLGHGMTYIDKNHSSTPEGEINDKVTGSDYDDVISVSVGNDLIIGSSGSDIITGGDGNDTVIYDIDVKVSIANVYQQFTVTKNDESSDLLQGIETIIIDGEGEYSLYNDNDTSFYVFEAYSDQPV
ncbi:hypothetical protein L4D20_03240 [Vibrio kyushuensis]|uniref:calcium-binding protein n=1 Tax=Vibrio kyushuensis TaxID=2910249 RepID=UPI003D09FA38